MKKVLIILGGLLVTLTASALIIPSFVDWSQYRDQITSLARDYTGREVTISGDISFQIIPNPALSLKGLSMRNKEGGVGDTLITLDALDINVAFMPLLSREIQVESLTLDGAVIALEVDENGVKNWIFFEETNTQKITQGNGFRLDIFNISGSTISYRDATRDVFETFSNINASLKVESSVGPFEAEGSLVSRSEPVEFNITSGRIVKARSFPLGIGLTLPGGEGSASFQGTIVLDGAASAASGEFKASGNNAQIFIKSIQTLFQKPMAHPVNVGRPFELTTKLLATKARIGLKPLFLKVGETVTKGDILYLPENETPNLDIALKVNNIKLDNWLLGNDLAPSPSIGTWALPALKGAIDISIEALEYGGGIVSRAGIKGTVDNNEFAIERLQALLPGGSDVRVMGKIGLANLNAPSFDGAVRISANNLRGLLGWAGINIDIIPPTQLASFTMDSGLKIEDNSYNFIRARGQLDITRFNGDARLRFGKRPNISINIGLSSFNLDSYFPSKTKSGEAKTWTDIQSDFDTTLTPLKDFDGNFKIKSQQATFRAAIFESFELDASLNRGTLNLKILKSDNALGIKTDISGKIEVVGAFPFLDLVVDLEAGTLAQLFKWAEIETEIDPFQLGVASTKGRIATDLRDVSLNLEGQGVFGTYSVEGDVKGLSKDPENFNIKAYITHPDHVDLLNRLKIENTFGGRPNPLTINLFTTGSYAEMVGNVDATILGGIAHIEGQVESVFDTPKGNLQIALNHSDLVEVGNIFNVTIAPSVESIGGFNLEGNFKGDRQNFVLDDLTSQVGPTKVTGEFKVNKKNLKPRVTGNVRLDKFPVDAFIKDSRTGAVEAHTIGGERWSRDLFQAGFINEWDADITITAGEVSFGRYKIKRPRADITSANNALNISGIRGLFFGGNAEADIILDATSTPKLLIDLSLRDVRMEGAVAAIADVRPVTGLLNMSGHFEAQGNSQFDMIASLEGTGELTAQDGVIKGINLQRLSNDIGGFSKLSDLVRVLGNSFGGGETQYSVLTTKIKAQSGLVETDGLTIAIEGIDVDGGASFNLPRWLMDGGGSFRLANETNAPPIGVKLTGQIDRPDIEYQTSRLKAYVGERIAQKALEATLGQKLPEILVGNTQVAVELLGNPIEEDVSPTPKAEETDGAKIIKGLYYLINSRKKPKEAEEGEELNCEGSDCPPY